MRPLVLCSPIVVLSVLWGCNETEKTLGPGPGPGPDPYAQARGTAVDIINGYCATLSLPALAHWSEADLCADQEAKHDSEVNQAHASFGSCGEYAQNECPGWPSADAIVDGCLEMMWNEGPGSNYSQHGHYINMSNPNYTKVSIGFYMTPTGKVWSVQNFK